MKKLIYIIIPFLVSCAGYSKLDTNVQQHGNIPLEVDGGRVETDLVLDTSSSGFWIVYIPILLMMLYLTYKSFSGDSKK